MPDTETIQSVPTSEADLDVVGSPAEGLDGQPCRMGVSFQFKHLYAADARNPKLTVFVAAAAALILAAASWVWTCEFRWPSRCSIVRPLAYGLVLAWERNALDKIQFEMLETSP